MLSDQFGPVPLAKFRPDLWSRIEFMPVYAASQINIVPLACHMCLGTQQALRSRICDRCTRAPGLEEAIIPSGSLLRWTQLGQCEYLNNIIGQNPRMVR